MKRTKREMRLIRHKRVRSKVSGSPERPRLCVYRSLKHIYAQAIDDTRGYTIASASTLSPELRGKLKSTKDKSASKEVGKLIGEKLIAIGIKRVAFDRNGFLYHGRVKELAEGAREAGLEF